jgi:hypothetical protein
MTWLSDCYKHSKNPALRRRCQICTKIQKIERLDQGGLKLQARTLATLPHSLVGHSMTYDVPKILKLIRHLK